MEQAEVRELSTFASFLSVLFKKVFREKAQALQVWIPDDTLGYDLVLTIQKAPEDSLTPEFFIEASVLENALDDDLDQLLKEVSDKLDED